MARTLGDYGTQVLELIINFIGTHGVIACLPSLPRVIEVAKEQGYTLKDFYIAIDEIDFGYQLLSIETVQSTKIKSILQQSVDTNGLVLAGQTEYTATLESFASELERDRQHEIQGFYNTATPVDSVVRLHRCLKAGGAGSNDAGGGNRFDKRDSGIRAECLRFLPNKARDDGVGGNV